MASHPMRPRVPVLVWMLLAALVGLVGARPAAARPIIPPEREDEVQALLQPHRLGDEVAPGWRLQSIAIELATIRVALAGPHQERAELTLDHPDYAPPGSRAHGSFAVRVVAQPRGSEAAVAELEAAVERNDDGRFWAVHGAVAREGEPQGRFGTGWRAWVTDGLLVLVVLAGVGGVLLRQALRGAPRWVAWALAGVVVLGGLVRLGMAEHASLEPWSYTRLMVVARMIYEGPLLAALHPAPVWLTEVVTTTVLGAALAAPLAVFLLAQPLLGSARAAVWCAGLVAVLPLHIRFSHGDVSSIPSLTLAALMFAMIQRGARQEELRWLVVMLVLLPVPMVLVFLLRPLNVLYAPLLLAMLLIEPRVAGRRILAIAAVVALVTFGFGVPHLLEEFGREVREGLSLSTVASAFDVLLSWEYNTLLNPRFTPPGLTVLALVGAVALAKARRWRLLALLAGWLLASLGTHAYVVPKSPFMQARYHLHLVVPFVCLAACGIEALLGRLRAHRHERALQLGLLGYLLASPVIHAGFIRDVAFNDQHEWAWVHGLRERIPAGCTIVEYGGRGHGARLRRVGAQVVDGMPASRWRVIEIPAPSAGASAGASVLPEDVRALLRDPPACTYWYEGLPCLVDREAGAAVAPVCEAVASIVALDEVERLELVSRPYDENLARGLGEGEALVLRVSRVRGQGSPAHRDRHTRATLSNPPDASIVPAGSNATDVATDSCSPTVSSSSPVCASSRRMR